MAKRKIHSTSFKSKLALEAIRGDQTVAELAAKYKVHPTMVTKGKKQAVEGMADTFFRGGRLLHGRPGRCHSKARPPYIFNSDQGSQFTSLAFTDVIKDRGIKISMDGKGAWMDNVFIERLRWSLK